MYQLLGNKTHQKLKPCLDLFEIGEDGELYYREKSLTKRNRELRELREIGIIGNALGIRGLREMGFNIPKTNLKPRYVLELLEEQLELPPKSDVANADDIELQEITENVARSVDNLIK